MLAYVRYINKGEIAEEMLFCKSLETTTTATDIYKLKHYLDVKNIPIEKITSCAPDGAPVIMGKKNGSLKLMKDENQDMLLVHYVCYSQRKLSSKKYFS